MGEWARARQVCSRHLDAMSARHGARSPKLEKPLRTLARVIEAGRGDSSDVLARLKDIEGPS